MVKRVAEVRQIAKTKRKVTPKLSGNTYAQASKAATVPPAFRKDAKEARASSSRRPTSSPRRRRARSSSRIKLEHFDELGQGRPRRREEEEPDALRRPDHRLDGREGDDRADERPKVAAVIYNRLKAGMPLGIDATIRYGLDVPGTEALRVSQLESDNPYNTRNRTGLPPTPIANPGLASMQAAAHPAKVNYLYFVRKPDKVHHFFTASESEFYAKACEYGYGCG